MSALTLSDAERMALDQFVAENWSAFRAKAREFLSEPEVEALGEKLAGDK